MDAKRDILVAQVLWDGMKSIQAKSALSLFDSNGIVHHDNLHLGEVTRHFDTNTNASIEGYMTHDLGFHGWGVGVGIGRFSLGTGRLGLSGTSQVSMASAGVNREDLTSDGVLAVFEQNINGRIDTLRVVMPSAQVAREAVLACLDEMATRFTSTRRDGRVDIAWPAAHSVFTTLASELTSFQCEVSYVSDRLNSILRMPIEQRPSIEVYGPSISAHALLGAAMRFEGDSDWLPLFPIAWIRELAPILDLALSVAVQGEKVLGSGQPPFTKLAACRYCRAASPLDVPACPGCGHVFRT